MDSASTVAAPASAAFPPCSRILMPAAVAAALPETTTHWLPTATLGCLAVTGVCVACGQAKETSKRRETVDIEVILRIRGELRCSRGHHTRHVIKAISSLLIRTFFRVLGHTVGTVISENSESGAITTNGMSVGIASLKPTSSPANFSFGRH